jgi:hypothetical protein
MVAHPRRSGLRARHCPLTSRAPDRRGGTRSGLTGRSVEIEPLGARQQDLLPVRLAVEDVLILGAHGPELQQGKAQVVSHIVGPLLEHQSSESHRAGGSAARPGDRLSDAPRPLSCTLPFGLWRARTSRGIQVSYPPKSRRRRGAINAPRRLRRGNLRARSRLGRGARSRSCLSMPLAATLT